MANGLVDAVLIVGGCIVGVTALLLVLVHIDPNTRQASMLSKVYPRRRRVETLLQDVTDAVAADPLPAPPAAPTDG